MEALAKSHQGGRKMLRYGVMSQRLLITPLLLDIAWCLKYIILTTFLLGVLTDWWLSNASGWGPELGRRRRTSQVSSSQQWASSSPKQAVSSPKAAAGQSQKLQDPSCHPPVGWDWNINWFRFLQSCYFEWEKISSRSDIKQSRGSHTWDKTKDRTACDSKATGHTRDGNAKR